MIPSTASGFSDRYNVCVDLSYIPQIAESFMYVYIMIILYPLSGREYNYTYYKKVLTNINTYVKIEYIVNNFGIYTYNKLERTQVSFGPWVFFLRKVVIWAIKFLKHTMSRYLF